MANIIAGGLQSILLFGLPKPNAYAEELKRHNLAIEQVAKGMVMVRTHCGESL